MKKVIEFSFDNPCKTLINSFLSSELTNRPMRQPVNTNVPVKS